MDTKKAVTSKTIIGVVVFVIGTLLYKFFGVSVTEAEQTTIAGYIGVGMEAVGTILAIYGRWKAEKHIKL